VNLLPWHHQQWNTVATALQAQRFPHALLLAGPSGMGKSIFAQQLVAVLICKTPTQNFRACGLCENCHLFSKGLYFDYQCIVPEENSKVIKIDQVRALNDWNIRSAIH
jgi:DNA polymerase-3 subunit delta'